MNFLFYKYDELERGCGKSKVLCRQRVESGRRNDKNNSVNQSRKRQRTLFKQQVDETEYVIKNGMRCVVPYIYKHETFCKQVGNLRVL